MNLILAQPVTARRLKRGFTLIEVMISVVLVLLLMYGVSQVFKLSSDAVGANQALARIIRDHRSISSVLADDWRDRAQDSPLFLISSRIGYAGPGAPASFATGFRNEQEQRDNSDPDPTTFDSATHQFLRLGSSDRVPRLDRLGFFARGAYRRQTFPTMQASLATSGEAYIWVGHLAVQNGAALQYPETQFAGQRILGREAILLKDVSSVNTAKEAPFVGGSSAVTGLWPFGFNDNKPFRDYSDVALITMDQFRQSADSAYQAGIGNATDPTNYWYRPMEDSGANIMRFWCDPKVSRPIDAKMLSQTVPIFASNCTQFIVEYAGDYLNQDPLQGTTVNGPQKLTSTAGSYDPSKLDVSEIINPTDGSTMYGNTDGQIDFVVDKTGDPTAGKTKPELWVHRIRWYGLPRDVNEDGVIGIDDVVPLADVIAFNQIQVNGKSPLASWEKELPAVPPTAGNYATTPNTNAGAFRYTCAWHNDSPAMIRILVKIDDPTGKLQDGQWYQYIFSR